MIKPKALKKGDRVRIIAPASPFDSEALDIGVRALENLGLEVCMADSLNGFSGDLPYLTASDSDRLGDLHDAFADKDTKAIFCARGGYGSMRLLENISTEIITQNPKIFVGYSDLTALLNLFTTNFSLVTFHGPVVAKDLDVDEHPITQKWLEKALMNANPLGVIDPKDFSHGEAVTLYGGKARGILVGGNLSLLSATMGTDFEIQTDGKILFIEEIGEDPYRIDRLFQHLKLAGKFQKIAGLLLGQFIPRENQKDAEEKDAETVLETLRNVLSPLNVPILYGFPAGHTAEKVTLPLGVQVVLDADQGILEVLESGVT